MTAPRQIPRGADLTEADLDQLADDAAVICMWAMRHRIKRDQWNAQIRKAFEARLGRRPLIEDPA